MQVLGHSFGQSIVEEAIQALVAARCGKALEENKKLKAKITELAPLAQIGRKFKESLQPGGLYAIRGRASLKDQDFAKLGGFVGGDGRYSHEILYSRYYEGEWAALDWRAEIAEVARWILMDPKVVQNELDRRARAAQMPLSKAQKRSRNHR